MKRLIALILSFTLLFSLSGCFSPTVKIPEVNFDTPTVTLPENDEVIVDSTLPALKLAQQPLNKLFPENRVYRDFVILNGYKYNNNWKWNDENYHVILCNVDKNNGVFVVTQSDGLVEIGWAEGQSNIQCYVVDMSNWDNVLDIHKGSILMGDTYDTEDQFRYCVYRANVEAEDYDEYGIMIDFLCDNSFMLLTVPFKHLDWEYVGEELYDDLACRVAKEVVEYLNISCTCCTPDKTK